ncbi:unnamed protein product, partial [Arabidopsis halleri]
MEIFQKTPKNKETILIRDILSRLQDKWKSSENIAGEAVYHPYIKRLKALAERRQHRSRIYTTQSSHSTN